MPNFGKKSTNVQKNRGKNREKRASIKKDLKPLKKDPGVFQLGKDKQKIESSFSHRLKNDQEKKKRQLSQLAARGMNDDDLFEETEQNEKGRDISEVRPLTEGSKRAFFKDFKKIIEMADVILEVLDARDPLGCRCIDMEKKILGSYPGKKIILILNKIDLVPRENVAAWLKYLRNSFPTLAFKASTQQQKNNLSQNTLDPNIAPENVLQSNESLGADSLLQLLKNYSRSLNLKTAISVGIIGYPNVGKSSIINSLKRSKAVNTGANPGVTKTVQKVSLDKHVHLLDCPGIVFGEMSEIDVILRNCIKVEQIEDPITPVGVILQRVPQEQICQLYGISKWETLTQFLVMLAKKRKRVMTGGIYDIEGVAKLVLTDWNSGKISFFTIPPITNNVIDSEVVNQFGKDFDISQFNPENNKEVSMEEESMYPLQPSIIPPPQSNQFVSNFGGVIERPEDAMNEESILGDQRREQQQQSGTIIGYIPDHQKPKQTIQKVQNLYTPEDDLNPQFGRQLQKNLKKLKKQRKKLEISNIDEEAESFQQFSNNNDLLNLEQLTTPNPFNVFRVEKEGSNQPIIAQPKFTFKKPAFTFIAKPQDQNNNNNNQNNNNQNNNNQNNNNQNNLFCKFEIQSEVDIRNEIEDLFLPKKITKKPINEEDDEDVDINIEEI